MHIASQPQAIQKFYNGEDGSAQFELLLIGHSKDTQDFVLSLRSMLATRRMRSYYGVATIANLQVFQ